MKRINLIMISLLALLFTFPAISYAGQTFISHFREEGFQADFRSRDGCMNTWVLVAVRDQLQKELPSGETFEGAHGVISILQFSTPDETDPETGEECPPIVLQDSSVTILDPDFSFDKNLKEGHFKGDAILEDLLGGSRFVTFDIHWRENGPIKHEGDTFREENDETIFMSRFDGWTRPAIAEGFIKEGEVNYTPERSRDEDTFLYRSRIDDTTIVKEKK